MRMSRRKEYYQHPLKEDLDTTNLWVDWELRTIYEIKKTIYKITFVSLLVGIRDRCPPPIPLATPRPGCCHSLASLK